MTFHRIKDKGDPAFLRLWVLYCNSFPEYERRSKADHCAALEDKDFYCLEIRDGQTFVGLLCCWQMEDCCYIEHFAIDPGLRGRNYGTRALEEFCCGKGQVILEIDPPVDDISVRRERFYHRLGFLTSEFSYTHPAFRIDGQPHPLVMLCRPEKMSQAGFEGFKQYLRERVMHYSERRGEPYAL